MCFAHIAIQSLKIKIDFSQILRPKFAYFQLDCNQAVHATMEKEHVYQKILTTYLNRKLRSNKTEVAP